MGIIADVKSLSDHLIYDQGKRTGTTNVILFDSSMKQIGILDVEVTLDIGMMLEVRFLEVSRNAGRDLGMNLYADNAHGSNIANSGSGGPTSINTNSGRVAMPNVGPPAASIPPLGTAGKLIASAGGVSPTPFGRLLTSLIRTSNGSSVDL